VQSRRYANWWKDGSWNISCQRTGFKIKAESSRMEWNGLIVRKESWEPRHPQDFLQGIPDYPAVDEPRPRPVQLVTNSANLLVDNNGQTDVYWDLGADWAKKSGGGWEITASAPFNVSSDLTGARSKDIPVGVNLPVRVGDTITLSGTTVLTTRTAGSFAGQVKFFEEDKSTVVQTSTLFTVSADSTARQSGSVVVPDSTAYLQVLWNCTTLQASVFNLTNVKLELGTLTGFTDKVTY